MRSAICRFHGEVKLYVLRHCAERVERSPLCLLDLGCGRGGDAEKWRRVGIEHALGLDPDAAAIDTARERCARLPAFAFACEASPADALRVVPPGSVDIVSWMFSVHYLPRERLRAMLADAARALSACGAVCMTFMEGDAVDALLGDAGVYRNAAIELQRAPDERVRVRLEDSVYFERGASLEYLVRGAHVRALADEAGFDVEEWPFAELARALRPALSDDEAVASALNVAVVLRKRPPPPPQQA
jgi:ubiquinone/menaquinone biosynthesis C-methylase UbiE